MGIIYFLIDKLFDFLNFYSNSELGNSLTVVPNHGDIWLILINVGISLGLSSYMVYKLKDYIEI